jgi:hypothetical protein
MTEWSKDHVVAIGSLTQHFGLFAETWLNGRPGGATRGKWGQLVGKVWEWVRGKPAPPPVSIKDRSVGPHEQVLNVPIAYR